MKALRLAYTNHCETQYLTKEVIRMNLKMYKRDCLLGALGAFLMLIGDLCLSVIPASAGDSGLFAREAYLNGSWEGWRLPLLLATGLCGMALGFFTVRASYLQIDKQYRKTRTAILIGGVIYIATAGALHLFIGSLADWTTTLSPLLGREETTALIQAHYERLMPAMYFAYAGMILLMSHKNLSIRDLNKRLFLPQRDEAVISELKKAMHEVDNPRIAIFSPSIEHSNRFAEMLSAAGIPCAALSKVDKAERRRRLLSFAAGSYQAVCAVDVMNEGIDIPDVNILVFLRATHSRRIFVQQLGRGLRLSEGKEKVIVLDFVSDIRRMAEMIDMNNEGKAKGAEHEVVYLRDGFVSFSDARVESFVNMWLEDVADLSGSDDEVKLKFPEGL